MKQTRLFFVLIALLLVVSLAGCGSTKSDNKDVKVIKVGATAGPQAQILEAVKPVLAKEGVTMEIMEFNDYSTPNTALNDGDLVATSHQHQPFLDAQIKDRGYEIESIGKTILMPMGLYSKKINSLEELPEGATVAIPNDPSNGGRALLLLQKFGLIKLNPKSGILPSVADITENPKNLKVTEVEAAQAPRVLDDVELVAVNTNYALVAGLNPTKDSLALEDKDSPYACVLVVRSKDKDNPELLKLLKAYQSSDVEKFIDDTYQGSIIKAW